MNTLYQINTILSIDKRIKVYFLFFSTLIISVLDLIGLSSILPILLILSDPNYLNNKYIIILLNNFYFLNKDNFLLYSIVFLFSVFLLKIILSLLFHYIKYKILWNYYEKISNRLISNYVKIDYLDFLNLKIYEKSNMLKSKVDYFIMGVIDPFFILLLEGLTIILIFIFLIYYDPASTLKVISALGFLVIFLMYFLGKKLKKLGTKRHNLHNFLQQQINQALNGVKDLKLSSKENFFLKNFYLVTKNMRYSMISINSWQMIPRHALEFLTIISFILICFIGFSSGKNFSELIILLGLYSAATFRIMPSLNRVMVSYNSIKQTKTVIDKIFLDFSIAKNITSFSDKSDRANQNIGEINNIEIKNLNFKFPNQKEFLIKDLELKIEKGQYIGIYGRSGVGKTTFVDLFSGLINPSSGSIKINSIERQNILPEWKSSIGYVSQKIYLNNTSIKDNVVFGLPIDEKKVLTCLKNAQILDFVNRLAQGIDTMVGENGANLSGGQIQRLGIARALYRNPKILIFDESTNSLDNETENAFMQVIDIIKDKKIILFISHKLSLLNRCDKIYEIKDKKLNLKKI